MSANAMMQKQKLLFGPKKSFDLPIYAEQLTLAFVELVALNQKIIEILML